MDWANGSASGEVGIESVIGIAADTHGVLWLLDMGNETAPAQIVAWNTITEELHRRIEIPSDVTVPISFLQDFALDEKREKIYIADMTFPAPGDLARPAFVVVDLKSGECWRVLEGADPLMPSERDVVIDGSLVGLQADERTPLHLGLNPIAIDPSFEWVYFGTIAGDSVLRIPAAALADKSRNDRLTQIERYAPKPPCDGIAVDGKGRVYVTDIEASAVGVATPGGYELLAQDSKLLSWPDGLALGPDASLYVSQNHLHAHPALNEGVDESRKPYHVLKIALP
ncbi:MAG: L-dopachrome tautomerase-related protein [Planctomycetota bacterium]